MTNMIFQLVTNITPRIISIKQKTFFSKTGYVIFSFRGMLYFFNKNKLMAIINIGCVAPIDFVIVGDRPDKAYTLHNPPIKQINSFNMKVLTFFL